MKAIISLSLFVTVAFLSCQKATPVGQVPTGSTMNSPEDSVTADVDGVHYVFNTQDYFYAAISLIYGGYTTELSLNNYAATSAINKIGVTFSPKNHQPVTVGTYDSTDYAEIDITMLSDNLGYTNNYIPIRNVAITVTAITDSSVTGTFSGVLYNYASNTAPATTKSVTNGRFFLKK